MPTQRPTLSTFTAAHPDDPARAVEAYRAALAEWRYAAHPPPQRPLRPVMAMAVGALLIAALLAIAALLGLGAAGCSSTDRHCRDRCGAAFTFPVPMPVPEPWFSQCVETCEGAEDQPVGETGGER